MSNLTPFTYTVTTLNQTIAQTLSNEPQLQWFYCVGEISNLIKHRSGHWYFSLKDETSVIKAVMFRQCNYRITTSINNGDQVIIYGHVDYYSPNGNLQVIVERMKLVGEGALLAKLEKLRQHYASKGYFDLSIKKPLPKYPFSIGLIVGANSAAQADAYKVLQQRWPIATVKEINPLVQGENAAGQIAKAILTLDEQVDVIVVVRGGGSIEDLWAFNESEVVEAAYDCHTPLVSGIGHESDTTLIDYVADYRANTPTGALVAATPNYDEVVQQISKAELQLNQIINQKINQAKNMLSIYRNVLSLEKIESQINQHRNRLNQYELVLANQLQRVDHFSTKLNYLNDALIKSLIKRHSDALAQFKALVVQLESLSPLKILAKGYSVTRKENDIVKSCAVLTINDTIITELSDGHVRSIITDIQGKE